MAADNQPTVGELVKRVLELEDQEVRTGLRIGELEAQALIDRHEIANLGIALHSARRIGAAMGIIMFAHKVTEEQAFFALRIASQHTQRKLRDIADEVLLTGLPPSPPALPPRPPRSGANATAGER